MWGKYPDGRSGGRKLPHALALFLFKKMKQRKKKGATLEYQLFFSDLRILILIDHWIIWIMTMFML